jgi:hypothetical protein
MYVDTHLLGIVYNKQPTAELWQKYIKYVEYVVWYLDTPSLGILVNKYNMS